METSEPKESEFGVYDDWRWHVDGAFPAGRAPSQGYVHIGIFVAWLVRHGMLDEARAAGGEARPAIDAIADRRAAPTSLREPTEGRLAAEMLTTEGRAFTSAYYAPEYGYPRDWQRIFGRRADAYAVADSWETYDLVEPTLDERYAEWVSKGRPELMPLPGVFVGRLARWLDRHLRR